MGMMNLSYFRDKDIDKLRNIFDESDLQSHFGSSGYMTFNPIAESDEMPGGHHANRLKAYYQDGDISGYLSASHPHHTSQKGVIIMTTDYMVDLCLHDLPESCESFSEALDYLTKAYRKDLMRRRHFIGRDHPMVTKKKLLAENPELIVTHGKEDAVPGQNLGHLVSMNFDCIDEGANDTVNNAAKDISEAYHSLVECPESSAPEPVFIMRYGPLGKYHGLYHWLSLTEADVVILEYRHFLPTRAFSGHREKRNTAYSLMKKINEMPEGSVSESIYLKEYVLMKEFFASQGYEINL